MGRGKRSDIEFRPTAVCAVILADRGERYPDTIYSDDRVIKHFGDVSHLWLESTRGKLCEMAI